MRPAHGIVATFALVVLSASGLSAQGRPSSHAHGGTGSFDACSVATLDSATAATTLRRDIVYRVVGTDTLRLDLATPATAATRPLVVIVHGGGWRAGNKSDRLAPTVRKLAAAGYAVASVDYRLTNGSANLFPAALEDVWCSIAFLRAKAGSYGIDARRIVIAGESAGAQLASMIALTPEIAGRACPDAGLAASLRGFVGMYGIYDYFGLDDQPRAAEAVAGNLGGAIGADSARARRASPVHHVKASVLPMLLVHGLADRSVAPDQSRRLRDAVLAKGGIAELIEVPGFDHGFPMIDESAELKTASCAMLAFLSRQFSAAAATPSSGARERSGVRVMATDFALTMPATAAPGIRRFRLVNAGKEPHYFGVMRLDSGKTIADYMTWRDSRTRRPGWLVVAGGASPIMPGDSTDLSMRLTPGKYIAFCSYPSPDGTSHLAKGMIREFTVHAAERAPDDVPVADAAMRLVNYAFTPPLTLVAGRRTLRLDNDSDELHQLLIIRLPTGVTPEQEIAWFRGGTRGPRPGIPAGGVLQLPPRERAWITMHLSPGRYLFLCPVGDPQGRPHDTLGMFAVVEVRGAAG